MLNTVGSRPLLMVSAPAAAHTGMWTRPCPTSSPSIYVTHDVLVNAPFVTKQRFCCRYLCFVGVCLMFCYCIQSFCLFWGGLFVGRLLYGKCGVCSLSSTTNVACYVLDTRRPVNTFFMNHIIKCIFDVLQDKPVFSPAITSILIPLCTLCTFSRGRVL